MLCDHIFTAINICIHNGLILHVSGSTCICQSLTLMCDYWICQSMETEAIFFYQKKMETGAVNLQFSFLLVILVQLWEVSTDREQHESNAVLSMGDPAVQWQREAAGGQPGTSISSWADSQGGWQRWAAGESGLPGMAGRLKRGPSSAQHSCLERLSLKRHLKMPSFGICHQTRVFSSSQRSSHRGRPN